MPVTVLNMRLFFLSVCETINAIDMASSFAFGSLYWFALVSV